MGAKNQYKNFQFNTTKKKKNRLSKIIGFVEDERFGFSVPLECEGVPSEILQPRETWSDKQRYDNVANLLAQMFRENFQQYEEGCST